MIRILIIRLSSLGDIVHTYPMIKDIKDNVKNCSIDWLVDESFKDLLKYNRGIDNIIYIPLRKWKKNKFGFFLNLFDWYKKIKIKNYDYIIDSQGLIKSALLTKFFIGNVYGYDKFSIREKLASAFYKYKINVSKNYLATIKNRILCQKIFNYNINIKQINFGISEYFSEIKKEIYSNGYVVFFHATSKNSKKYPYAYWAEIASYIIKHTNCKIILPYGNNKEMEDAREIKKILNSDLVIIPKKIFSFDELHFLIYNAEIILGVDTGLIHLANALNKKTIAIYTKTNPNKTGIIESNIAKNIGNINVIPNPNEVIKIYENIMKV
jgi:heptosyltransferase-1